MNPGVDLLIDPIESASQRAARWLREAKKNSQSGPKNMVVGSGEEQSNAKTEAGQGDIDECVGCVRQVRAVANDADDMSFSRA